MSTKTIYNAQYFIDRFKAIPYKLWRSDGGFGHLEETKCALGHCDWLAGRTSEGRRRGDALIDLFGDHLDRSVTEINDGNEPDSAGFNQTTARGRVLAGLRAILKKGG